MKKNSYFVGLVIFLSFAIGWVIWSFVMGNPDNFADGAARTHPKGGNILGTMYLGGFMVPILVGLLLMTFAFLFERLISLKKAKGKRDLDAFLKQADKHLSEGNINAVLDLCNQQKGSVANIVRAGVERFKETQNSPELTSTQKVAEVKRALEEVTMLETPLLERNLVILSTIASIATMAGLLGTVFGMIRSFRALGEGGAGASATQLSIGISEALWNTALGIGGGIVAIIFYNILTNKVDRFIYVIDEATLTLVESLENRFLGRA